MYNTTTDKVNRISWGAIFAGTVTALAVSTMLNLLGLGIGFSSIDPLSEVHPLEGLGIGTIIWWGLSNLIALFIGGYIAGRVSGYPSKQDGGVHGFLSWSLYALVSFLLLVGAVNTTISGITGAVGSIFGDNNDKEVMVNLKNAQKESQKEAGSTLQNIQQDIYNIVNKAEKLNIVPQDATEEMREAQSNLDQKAAGALEEMELEEAVSEFVKELEFNIDNEGNLNIDTGDGELLDKKGLKDYLTNNTELSDSEIDGMINKWEAKIEKGIDKAEKLYADAKEKAVEIADKTADIAGKVAWGAFIILFLGAIVSILGGSLGSPSHLVREDNDETTRERRR